MPVLVWNIKNQIKYLFLAAAAAVFERRKLVCCVWKRGEREKGMTRGFLHGEW